MLYITGDTHIPIDVRKLAVTKFPSHNMTRDDHLIICGDFGGVWNGSPEEKYWIKWLSSKNFTTLFVDGNHENHQMLANDYEVSEYCGGNVHQIADRVYHLMRGEVFFINNTKIFAMGGASSHDRLVRKEGISWWPEELPSDDEYQHAIHNLAKNNWAVDLIVSHCCPDSIQAQINSYYEHDKLTNFFESVVKSRCVYNKWFFGHYHLDRQIDEKHICVYDEIIPFTC